MNTAEKVLSVLETVVTEARLWLPHETEVGPFHSENQRLSPETRTKLAFLEDSLKKATALVHAPVPLVVHNPNCDGGRCISETGEVRLLPTGRLPSDGNMILCRNCYEYEMAYRRSRNKSLGRDCQFKLPAWEDLKVYS